MTQVDSRRRPILLARPLVAALTESGKPFRIASLDSTPMRESLERTVRMYTTLWGVDVTPAINLASLAREAKRQENERRMVELCTSLQSTVCTGRLVVYPVPPRAPNGRLRPTAAQKRDARLLALAFKRQGRDAAITARMVRSRKVWHVYADLAIRDNCKHREFTTWLDSRRN